MGPTPRGGAPGGPAWPHGVEAPWPSSDSSLDSVVVSGKAPEPFRSRVDDDGGDITFSGIMISYLGFLGRRE